MRETLTSLCTLTPPKKKGASETLGQNFRTLNPELTVLAHLVLTHFVAQQEIDPRGGKGAQEHGESSHLRCAVREQEGECESIRTWRTEV